MTMGEITFIAKNSKDFFSQNNHSNIYGKAVGTKTKRQVILEAGS
jgi:hypothetical protein